MDRLRWTTENPTKPGWYWIRYGYDKPNPLVVHVTESNGIWYRDSWVLDQSETVEWAGPIPEPEE